MSWPCPQTPVLGNHVSFGLRAPPSRDDVGYGFSPLNTPQPLDLGVMDDPVPPHGSWLNFWDAKVQPLDFTSLSHSCKILNVSTFASAPLRYQSAWLLTSTPHPDISRPPSNRWKESPFSPHSRFLFSLLQALPLLVLTALLNSCWL